MASPSTVFDSTAPHFASDPAKDDFLTLAVDRTNECYYGKMYNLAVALRAAHMLTLAKRTTGEAGTVASKREGDLAVSYASSTGQESDDLDQTHYGKQLKGLRKGYGVAIGVIGGNDDGCWP